MKFIYPAILSPSSKGGYDARFPDLEACTAHGDTLDEAVENANAAAYDWLTLELSDEDPILPAVSDPEDLDLGEGEICRRIMVNIRFYEGWDE